MDNTERRQCLRCEKSFSKPYNESINAWYNRQFCSNSCKYPPKITLECNNCHVKFTVRNSYKLSKFCSMVCKGKSQRGKATWSKGIKANQDERIKRFSEAATKANKGKIPWNKDIHQLQTTGEKNGNWRGGSTLIREQLRKSLEYEEWRKAVFERDLYTCQACGEVGGRLNADHIKPFSLFPELRLSIDNGRTLCENCHRKTFSYLNSKMKREDFI